MTHQQQQITADDIRLEVSDKGYFIEVYSKSIASIPFENIQGRIILQEQLKQKLLSGLKLIDEVKKEILMIDNATESQNEVLHSERVKNTDYKLVGTESYYQKLQSLLDKAGVES